MANRISEHDDVFAAGHGAQPPETQARPVEGTRERLRELMARYRQLGWTNEALFNEILRDFTVTPRAPEPPHDGYLMSCGCWHTCIGHKPADAPKPDTLESEAVAPRSLVFAAEVFAIDRYPRTRPDDRITFAEAVFLAADFARTIRQRDREKVEVWRKAMLYADTDEELVQLLEHGPEWGE